MLLSLTTSDLMALGQKALDGSLQTKTPNQNLCRVWSSIHLAEEVGQGLGASQILQRSLSWIEEQLCQAELGDLVRKRQMGMSYGDFVKYPRTPHLFGSSGTDDDRHLGERETEKFLADPSLIVEEKVDGTNVGIHFSAEGELRLQCRGHLITEGMHPQYDLFKQWAAVKRETFESFLEDRFILFGEWLYARHTVAYHKLPHYFFEFDIYDKQRQAFLDLETRKAMLDGTGIETVPVVHVGAIKNQALPKLIGPSAFLSEFDNPATGKVDGLMEGIYLRTEANGVVTGRAKYVRPEFTERVKLSTHWQQQTMVPNRLAEGVDLWS